MEIVELDRTLLKQMSERAQPVYDMIRETVGADLMDEYLNAVENAS